MDASSPTLERRREVVERLESLVRAGVITRYTVRTWPRQVVLDGPNDDVAAVYHRFRRWAADQDLSVERAFNRRHHNQRITGERGELVSLPAVALAVYEGSELVSVAPHDDGETRTSVDEVLRSLPDRATQRTVVSH
jgi:DNA-binding Lrp family transcriptional regulator